MRAVRIASSAFAIGAALCLVPLSDQAQDLDRVRRTIDDLTAPAMHGRGYVRQGERRAAEYLRKQFQQIGLQPLATNFWQPFQLDVNTFPSQLSLKVDGRELRPGYDFIAEPASGGGGVTGPVCYLDTLIFSNEAAGQQFLLRPLRGQVLVLHQRDAERIRTLPATFAQHLESAAARITLVTGKLTASLAPEQWPQPRLQVLANQWPQGPSKKVSLRIEAQLQEHYPTQNVVGYIRGNAQPDSFLVFTAHYDHLGRMGSRTYFPGANDNASGTALLLELAHYYTQPQNRPAYSVAFIAFGAEEAGLVGSHYFVEHPLVPLERIRFLLNLDLEGTGQDGATVVNGRIYEQAFQRMSRLNEQQHFLPAIGARGRAANSDHYPFSEAGVPAFFIYTRGTPTHYHDVYDQSSTLPLTGFAGVFKLVVAFMNELGAHSTK
jgi:hypothetical protein